MKSQESRVSDETSPNWEVSLERVILPVEVTTAQKPVSKITLLQDESVVRAVNILREKISKI